MSALYFAFLPNLCFCLCPHPLGSCSQLPVLAWAAQCTVPWVPVAVTLLSQGPPGLLLLVQLAWEGGLWVSGAPAIHVLFCLKQNIMCFLPGFQTMCFEADMFRLYRPWPRGGRLRPVRPCATTHAGRQRQLLNCQIYFNLKVAFQRVSLIKSERPGCQLQ